MTTNAERFVARFAELWAAPEPAAYATLWHDDGTLLHPGMETPIAAAEIPAYVHRLLEALPDITLAPTRWAARDDTVLVEWTITAGFRGERVSWNGADRFTLRGDRAIEGVAYFDTLPIWQKVNPALRNALDTDRFGLLERRERV
jgi:ketosteroid isomerase-like protein